MGWNEVKLSGDRESLLAGVKDSQYFYFVHSYYAKPDDASLIQGSADYGVQFPAILGKRNVWATQFHPEKSQEEGLKILENFVKLKP